MNKTFIFSINTKNGQKQIKITLPFENGGIVTNSFCPNSFLVGNGPLSFAMSAINGESEDDFISDCENQINYINHQSIISLNSHINALKYVVQMHANRCGRIIFNDLLIYVDIFAQILKAVNYSDNEIQKLYIIVVNEIVENYGTMVKNAVNLAPLKQTPIYFCIKDALNNIN